MTELNHDKADCNYDDNLWMMVNSAERWNEPTISKILEGEKLDLDLHPMTKFFHDNLMEWQKFHNGTLTRHDKSPFDHWW